MTQLENVLSIIQNAAATGARELDLRDHDLDSLPSEIGLITTLEILWLDRNSLSSLPNSLQHLRNLHTLSLRHNQLLTLPEWLPRLQNLRQLYIDHNPFLRVPDEVWLMNDLVGLGLSGIRKPDLSNIREYPNLLTLYLQECGLHEVPKGLFPLERLTSVYLEGNQLSDLPYYFATMQDLETIYLGRNSFKSVPETLMRMRQLRYINLAQNEIQELPSRISNWTELRTLVVANNPLGRLPQQIGTLKKLTSLYAYSADLLELPDNLIHADNLEILEVGSNLLTALPLQISRLKKLERLNLFNNGLVEIPLSVCGLVKLKELLIDSNELQRLFPEIGQLRQLELLDVRNNRLSELPSQIGNLPKLRVLRVANNQLDALPDTVGDLHQLTDLDVSFNRGLHRFPTTMTNLSRLNTLTLTGIGITVPEDIRGNVNQMLQFLSQQNDGRVQVGLGVDVRIHDAVSRPAVRRSTSDDFEINFLPDINELKRAEQRSGSERPTLRISRFELDGIVDVFPYQKLQVVYMFEHTMLPVPPWFVAHMFLARTRRFRTKKSWLGGGVLAYENADPDSAQHVARLDSSLEHNALALTVIGPFPQNFFSLLLAGLDRVVNGLSQAQVAHRLLYCPDPNGENCRHRFDFDALLSALGTLSNDLVIPCPNCGSQINFHEALAGLHPRTASVVRGAQTKLEELIGEVDEGDADAIEVYYHLLSLRQRYFLQLFQRPQLSEKTHFPRFFLLRATSLQNQSLTSENIFDYPLELEWCNESPGQAQPTGLRVIIDQPRLMLTQWRPYLLALKTILPTIFHTAADDFSLRSDIDETIRIIDLIPDNELIDSDLLGQSTMEYAIQSLHRFFDIHCSGWYRTAGFRKYRTPEGLYLWVDREHARWLED